MSTLAEAFKQLEAATVERIIEHVQRSLSVYAKISKEELRKRGYAATGPFTQDLQEPDPHHYRDYFSKVGYERAQQEVPMEDALQALRIINLEILNGFKALYANDPARLVEALETSYSIMETGSLAFYGGYERARNEVIESQQSALQELSTPIIPIYQGILVLPLVGSIDAQRAGQIMEALLEGINASSADVVIMDITGVPVIDTGVANYIVQAARAARLLGSKVVLVGIGAEIAQTVVQLGIDLTGIITRSNLQTGIEYALSTRGLAIGPATQATRSRY